MANPKRPVMIEIEDEPILTPDEAPEVTDAEGRAMQGVIGVMGRRRSVLGRLFTWAFGALVSLGVSVWLWDFVSGLLSRSQTLGALAAGLAALLVIAVLFMALRELAGFRRMRRIDALRTRGRRALADKNMEQARQVAGALVGLYASRPDMEWQMARYREAQGEVFDADAHLALVETHLLAPLDKVASEKVQAAARQVALVTAFVPLTFADLLVALSANLRMIRAVSEIYGGRGGALGNWRLAKAVIAHLLAAGAVSIGDDLLEPVIGGGLLGKVSRRFGEGLVNGVLTARVGAAAMEVCRPLEFTATPRPPVRKMVRRALTGVFGKTQKDGNEQP